MPAAADTKKGQNVARTHTNRSNRKIRGKVEGRPAFKSVLSNPFEVQWPRIDSDVQNAVLARVTELLRGVAEFNLQRQRSSRSKRKKGKGPEKNANKGDKPLDSGEEVPSEHGDSLSITIPAPSSTSSPPAVLRRITIGINEVTKRLESHCQVPRLTISEASEEMKESISGPSSRIGVVIVCKSDMDPPSLVAHLPYLVAACNNVITITGKIVKLVTLPRGSEFSVSQAAGLRRVAVLAMDETLAEDPILAPLLASVSPVVAPWLTAAPMQAKPKRSLDVLPRKRPRTVEKGLIRTHIKQLRTTAPKDMRAAKELRARARAKAKIGRKAVKEKKSISTSAIHSNVSQPPSV